MRSAALALLLLACSTAVLEARLQNITVKGVVVCNKKRMSQAHVQLWEKDTLDPDDLLKEMHTNSEGVFELYGEEDESAHSIHPYLLITHTCNVKEGCKRVSLYEVPKSKIGGVYDMTYVTLDIKVHGEKEKC